MISTIATIVALPVFIVAEVFFWFSVRPVSCVILIAVSCVIAYLILTRHKQKLAVNAAASAVTNPITPTLCLGSFATIKNVAFKGFLMIRSRKN